MKLNKHLIKYEMRNYLNNLMGLCYLIILPLGLALLFSLITETGVNPSTSTYMLILFCSLIPISATFNHAGNYANEIESGTVQRFKLFGYSEKKLLMSKLIVNLIFITIAFIIYFGVLFLALDIMPPAAIAFIALIVFMYIFSIILFVVMHATAILCRSFSTTYGLTLIMFFVFMLLGGMMGADLGAISNVFPTYHLGKNYLAFWNGGFYNFLPLALSTLGFAMFSAILMMLSVLVIKKRINGKERKHRK